MSKPPGITLKITLPQDRAAIAKAGIRVALASGPDAHPDDEWAAKLAKFIVDGVQKDVV